MRSWKSSKPSVDQAPAKAPVPVTAAAGTGSSAPAFLEIAQIQTTFGVDGEVRARILTDFPRRFARLKKVFLGDACRPYVVEHAKVRGDEVFLKLGGVSTPEEAAKLRLQMVQVPTVEAMPLPKGAFYHYQVIGLTVVTLDGQALGKVSEILPTGSNDVYIVQGDKSELLVPAIADVVRQVDLEAGRMVVALLEGMEPVPVAAPAPKPVRPPQIKRPRASSVLAKPAAKPAEAARAEHATPARIAVKRAGPARPAKISAKPESAGIEGAAPLPVAPKE